MNNFKKNKLVGTRLSTLGREISAAYADVVFPKPVKSSLKDSISMKRIREIYLILLVLKL